MNDFMFGGLGGMDPKKMQAIMKQMGIKQDEIEATRVIIEKVDGKIVIDEPNVMKITMQGNESWQITGEAREESAGISDSDISMVMEKTGKSKKEALKALEAANGDIAAAIMGLSE